MAASDGKAYEYIRDSQIEEGIDPLHEAVALKIMADIPGTK